MSRGSRWFSSLILSIFLDSGGCGPSSPTVAPPPQASPAQIGDAPGRLRPMRSGRTRSGRS